MPNPSNPLVFIDPSQAVQIQSFIANQQYAEGYRYVKSIVDSALLHEGDLDKTRDLDILSNWLSNAAEINADDGSFKSEFVRGATEAAGASVGKPITDAEFQTASDNLAVDVLSGIADKLAVPNASTIIQKDVNAAVQELGLPPWGWAGTFGDIFPIGLFGGLGKNFVSIPDSLEAWFKVVDANGAGVLRAIESFILGDLSKLAELEKAILGSLGVVLDVTPATSINFTAAQRFIPRRDPLAFDLDGDGLETIPASTTNPILFDIDGSGVKVGTGWLKADDGFLALDRDGNGTIDSGQELFGDSTPIFDANGIEVRKAEDGFDALAQQDTNHDGIISALDARWADLRIWQDANQDAISDPGELKTLAELGIASINVNRTEHSTLLANGNEIADLGTFTRTDGNPLVRVTMNGSDVLYSGAANDKQWKKAA